MKKIFGAFLGLFVAKNEVVEAPTVRRVLLSPQQIDTIRRNAEEVVIDQLASRQLARYIEAYKKR